MRVVRRAALAAAAGVVFAVPAHAQEAGQVGITLGYPASVGLIWHVTDSVAVRPELSFALGTSETHSAVFDTEGDSSTFATGVAALFRVREWDDVRAYVGPRFAYGRSTTTSENLIDDVTELNSTTYELAGLFGVQYTPHRRFAVFGEVGIGYTNRDIESGESAVILESRNWGTQTGAGIIFYLGR